MTLAAIEPTTDYLRALPGDDVRQILWRFADRYDLQMLVQSARAVARGPVARLVAEGARNTHEWTAEKQALLTAFDESGITGVFMDPEQGGFIEGPKNLALALVAFELAWVDAGAATGSLAGNLALSPDPRARHAGAARPLHGAGRARRSRARTASPGAAPSASPSPSRSSASRPACWAARCASPSGRRARSRCCRWRSAAASSPTWASPTSSPPRWIPTTRASRAPAWSSWRRATRAPSTAARHQEAGPPALLHPRPDLQPAGPGQPHHRRLHGEGRRDRPALQPRRDHRGGLPPHARHGRRHDLGQAALARSSR